MHAEYSQLMLNSARSAKNKSSLQIGRILLMASLLLTGCHPNSGLFEPCFEYTPQKRYLQSLPSAFEPLSSQELQEDWGKEIKIGNALAQDLDLYRAITGYKRATILMPPETSDRRLQADFAMFQSYWMGGKYCEAIEVFEVTPLHTVSSAFPAFRELLVILYDCYLHTQQEEKAHAVIALMERGAPETALDLKLFTAFSNGNLACVQEYAKNHPGKQEVDSFVEGFHRCKKSVRTAQTLNALLPGAGYWYVGQKKSAVTSFLINTAFASAAYYFIHEGNWGAAAIAASLESGWYFGGINGAGLAARDYNEWLYQASGKDLMIRKKLFPVLMLETSF